MKNHQKVTQKWALQHTYFKMWALNLKISPKVMVAKWQDHQNLTTLKP
jgi:hypothetical protein